MEDTVHISKHPVVAHKLSLLRSADTSSQQYRHLLREITLYIGYEATAHLTNEKTSVKTTTGESTDGHELKEKVAIVPIMRSGLGMVDSMLDLLPNSAVHHIGIYNDKTSECPILYYNKLPRTCEADVAIVLEPMISSGATLHATVTILKEWGCKHVIIMSIVGSKRGIEFLADRHPDVTIHVAAVDAELTSTGVISPGIGDCGDRLFDGKKAALVKEVVKEAVSAEEPPKKRKKV